MQTVIKTEEVMSGFCYAFSKAMLDKLDSMYKEYYGFWEHPDSEKADEPSMLVRNLCHHLRQQIPHANWDYILASKRHYPLEKKYVSDLEALMSKNDLPPIEYDDVIKDIINEVYQFLYVFEKK